MLDAVALIPVWIRKNDSCASKDFPARPVLIHIAAPPTTLHGQLLELKPTTLRVQPDVPILLCASVQVEIRFRLGEVVYSLTGAALPNLTSDDLVFEFDSVTRRKIATLRGYLMEVGLLLNENHEWEPEEHTPARRAMPAPAKPTKAELRRVCRLPPPGGIERRVHSRHELDTTATLVVVEKGVVFRCDLLEVSLGGCRVFSDNPVTIPDQALVEVDFIGRGYPIRVATVVRENRDGHVLGMQFQKMSARLRERLQELIEELRAEELLVDP